MGTLQDRDLRRHEIAEIGLQEGGLFFPHATHKEGLSVDIMTPMRHGHDHSPARLTTGPLSLFGYCWHIDPDTYRLSGLQWDAIRDHPSVRTCRSPRTRRWTSPQWRA